MYDQFFTRPLTGYDFYEILNPEKKVNQFTHLMKYLWKALLGN